MMPLQQTTFENIVTKSRAFPTFATMFSIIYYSLIEIVCVSEHLFSRSSAADVWGRFGSSR